MHYVLTEFFTPIEATAHENPKAPDADSETIGFSLPGHFVYGSVQRPACRTAPVQGG